MSVPRISVILPVYNAGGFLVEALDSLLNQTFRDFEVIAIDDASTDNSAAVLASRDDSRIRVIRHSRNERLPATLNHGLDVARGEFIARMDADDICHLRRFERQVRCLEAHPKVGICGTWVRLFGSLPSAIQKYPVSPDEVEAFRFFNCPFAHPTVMLRRELLEDPRVRYDLKASAVEDFELWTRLLKITRGANLAETLLYYRQHEKSVTSKEWSVMDKNAATVLGSAIRNILPTVTEEEVRFHRQVAMAEIPANTDSLRQANNWLCQIAPTLDRNQGARKVLQYVWFRLAMRVAASAGLASLGEALRGEFPRRYGLGSRQRCLIVGAATKAWMKAP